MVQSRWIVDDKIWRKRTPNYPCHESTLPRNAQEQRRWKIIDTLLCRWGYDWKCFSHNNFCLSALPTEQSQKCVKNMNPFMIERGNTLWEDSRVPHSCQAWSRQTCFWIVMILPKIRRTNWKVITTRQIEQILYGFRIPECLWNLTVFHDERCCIILTIHWCSGLSWVHSGKRWRNIWTERLDQREHQNWARIGSYNLLPAR